MSCAAAYQQPGGRGRPCVSPAFQRVPRHRARCRRPTLIGARGDPSNPISVSSGRAHWRRGTRSLASTMMLASRSRTVLASWCLPRHSAKSAAAISISPSQSASQQREVSKPSRHALHCRPNRRRHRRLGATSGVDGPVANLDATLVDKRHLYLYFSL